MDIPIDFAIYERCHEQNAPRNFKVEKMSKVCRRDVETVPGKTTPSKPPEKVFGAAGVYFFGFSDVDIMPTCHIGNCKSGQITIIPKPECFGHFGGNSPTKPPIWGDYSAGTGRYNLLLKRHSQESHSGNETPFT